ncbi:MAG: TetR/AcrR family transcriptional regulator [Ruminococcus sp.]|nr:TetR/AcrR family transcriptional regulator [Ruminococcus sp.]
MIKSTFYNLPEEKRNRIIDAVMMEFASSSTEKVSINRIIKTADISRGSFYQYFDDKVDLIEVITKFIIGISIEKINSVIEASGGDVFYTYIELFKIITNMGNDTKTKSVLKNLFKNLKANDDLISDFILNRFKGFAEIEDMTNKFNRDNLRFKDDEDVKNLSLILSQLLKNAVFNVFVMGEDDQLVLKNLLRKFEIIKNGAVVESSTQK